MQIVEKSLFNSSMLFIKLIHISTQKSYYMEKYLKTLFIIVQIFCCFIFIFFMMVDIVESWKISDCTILFDRWSDIKNKSLINFQVYSKYGIIFKKSIDASDREKDANLLCDLIDQSMNEVVEDNVIQVITNNVVNFILIGNNIINIYPSLYWNSCSFHCIYLHLKDIEKIPWVKEVVDQASTITRYIFLILSFFSLS